MFRPPRIIPALLLLLGALPLFSQDLASIEKRVTVHKLANGLTVVIYQRPEAPVFSFYTFVDAGSAQDPKGASGLAHMFEHMAFKGTDTIGTTNYPAEKAALEKVEKVYAAYIYERDKLVNHDEAKVAQLQKQWQAAADEANQYVVRNAFGRIVEENGGVGLNASTSEDETVYFYSMPVNRLELWAYLESSRLLNPVMREFYKERDVVHEERRMRVDSSPVGRLLEQFLAASFAAGPYGTPGVGWPSDLESFSATQAMEFYRRYYVPSNIVVALVGDIDPAQALPVVEKYFGRLPAGKEPDERATDPPPQNSERTVLLHDMAQPFYLEGYHRPDYRSSDDAVYDAITDIMSNGRVSRLYRSLVEEKKIAAAAAGFSGLPGTKYPQLFAFYAVPIPGHKLDELRDAIHDEINKLMTEPVTDSELERFKTRAKADLIRSLGSNSGMASELAVFQARYGDWRELFRQLDRYDKVSKEDIMRVAKKTFLPTNRTVGILETQAAKAAPAPGSQPAGAEKEQ